MKLGNDIFLVILGLGVGITLALQVGINATLRTALPSPVHAALVSFAVGTLLLAALAVAQGAQGVALPSLRQLPWWAWLGGVLGAFNVALSIFLAPRLGALLLAGTLITGQLLASLLLDKFGWLGYPKIPLDGQRLLGAALLLAGLFLLASR